MRFICLLIYILSRISSFSRGFAVATIPELIRESMAKEVCQHRLGFVLKKDDPLLHLCLERTNIFSYAIEGFKKAMQQCRANFKCHRWNCTTHKSGHEYKLFGIGMARASKEAAVMLAMASAGMVEYITSEIQKGKKERYQASPNGCYQVRRPRNAKEYVSVNECDADVSEGNNFAKRVIEKWRPQQKSNNKERMMNNHNAATGRMAIREHMQQVCRCIGLSGACNAKCCYKTLQPLKMSTDWLRKKYDSAKKVQTSGRPKRDGNGYKLVTVPTADVPAKSDLIYLLDSPNYCSNDLNTGSMGTSGRQCNACNSTTGGLSSCEDMCCGRGYVKHEIDEKITCKCKFNFCCEVKCEKCPERVIIHRCK